MGGTVSSGDSNDELVDNLVAANYITKPAVERVFRCVDRGHYFPEGSDTADKLAYRDVAWKMGHVHISAPCIYSEVMENICLEPGLSFLNLGSGTGYLNTMAGLMLGASGVNHGIEIYEGMVEYAEKRLAEFMARPGAQDEFEFCPPKFIWGNVLLLPAGTLYDRIYCGAACNEGAQLEYLKGLVKVGGILITPVDSELVLYKRTSENEWMSKVLLPVSFASLLPANERFMTYPVIPRSNPLGLEDICRFSVRSILRRNIVAEHPELVDCSARRAARKRVFEKRKARSDDSEEEWTSDVSSRVKLDSGIVEDIEDSDIESLEWENEWTSESESEGSSTEHPVVPVATFSDLMREKIQLLNLPKPLLQFLNLGRVL